jgi:hypothetical protein
MSRINYRNYPTIEMIGDVENKKHNIKVYQEDTESSRQNVDEILKITKETLIKKTKVTSVSKNFVDTVIYSFDKIADIINKDIKDGQRIILEESFIIDGFIIHTVQRYSLMEFYVKTSVFAKDGYLVGVYYTDKPHSFNFLWETRTQPYFYSINKNRYNLAIYFTKIVLNISYFKKYASVEIIESKAKTKRNLFGCKYLNETDLDIEYLDSKWFTTLVNDKGFKVRGFFRLQPKKKDGEWTKELIWIDEFEKKGYLRKAKLTINN